MKTKNFDETFSGEIQERIKSDPEDISMVFAVVEYNLFNIITEIFMLGYVLYLNVLMGLIFIIGEGSHKNLLKTNKHYKELYKK